MADERKQELARRVEEIESAMQGADFWSDKARAQAMIRELGELKAEVEGFGRYDAGNALLTLFSGAGGDDAEDFSRMLYEMYQRYAAKRGWGVRLLHANENDHGGYRNLTIEIAGKGAYGALKNESGVHRLVRISPFSAKDQRHTSFSLVDVVPDLPKLSGVELNEADLDIQFARSSGPGGQNVNKRSTAVRIVHRPTGIAVHADSERMQSANKERALQILKGKLYKKQEEDHKKEAQGLSISPTASIEWGSQIRSYVLHPYKLVKDHRTDVESKQVEAVLAGELDAFIDAERSLE